MDDRLRREVALFDYEYADTELHEVSPEQVAEAAEDFAIIRRGLDAWHEGGVIDALTRVHRDRRWAWLGFTTWADACDELLGGYRPAMPADVRREHVAQLRESGLSTRAIATAVGVSKNTVHRDLESAVPNGTPGPVLGLDGKTYSAKPATVEGEVLTAEDWHDQVYVPEVRAELDGEPQPKPPRLGLGDLDDGDDGGVFRTIAANTYDAAWSQAASNLAAAAGYFRSGFYPRPELPNRDASIRRFLDNLGYIITAIEKETEQ